MDDAIRKKKVLCPVEGKDGKTYWVKLGMAFINADSSINVYLDCLPVNGKLQIRDWEERDRRDGAPRETVAAPAARQTEVPF